MPSIITKCRDLFKTDDLYKVLGVQNNSSKQELKKGYHRRALAYHPDRAEKDDKEVATKKFQALGHVYSILSDDDRRKVYDETGDVDEDSVAIDQDRDWDQYWRLIFPKISQKDIEEFAEKYQGSPEELTDLKQAYLDNEGDMGAILDTVPCCSFEDEPRFTDILADLIQSGDLPDFDKFSKENKKSKSSRMKKAQAEAKEAEEAAKKLKLGEGNASLFAAIAQRQASRAAQADDFLSQLEAKYAGNGGKKGKKTKGK